MILKCTNRQNSANTDGTTWLLLIYATNEHENIPAHLLKAIKMDWFILLLLAAIVWFWIDSLRALDAARIAGRRECKKYDVQFLDDAISSIAIALVRDDFGRLVIRRTYRFEFSETGDSRLEGRLILLGKKVESVSMEPYQIMS